MSQPNNHIIRWHIRILKDQPSEPLYRDYDLDPVGLAPDELRDLFAIVTSVNTPQREQVRKYRKHFKPVADNESREKASHPVLAFQLAGYCENESGQPHEMSVITQIPSGMEQISFAFHDLTRVTDIGPTPMKAAAKWDTDKANSIAHFLEVVECLTKSDWINDHVSTRTAVSETGVYVVINTLQPNVLMVNSVLTFVRQLVADDDLLFKHAASAYLQHSSNEAKIDWVKAEKKKFNAVWQKPDVFQPMSLGMMGQAVLKLYFYSFGLLHAPKPQDIQEFSAAVHQHGHETLTMAFHMTMQHLVAHAHNCAAVIRQDFESWTEEGHAKPDRIGIVDVLGKI